MELLERFARGEMDAFETLFRQFQADVFRWVVRIVRERAAAEDLTVEAFWKIYRAHARFDPAGNFAGWARRIATNLALDHLRKARREVPLEEDFAAPAQPNAGAQRETRERIALAFRQLSPKLRVVATLSLLEDLPHREIADALGISEAAVRVRIFRATRILREKLKGSV